MYKICCIDGNIGAGKSTVLDELENRGLQVFREKIEDWKWCLDNFYRDPKRWAFTLQVMILNSFSDQQDKISERCTNIVFIERSPISMWVFACVGCRRGYFSQGEMDLLGELTKKLGWNPDYTLYINTPVTECFNRIHQRNRSCEQNIDIEYLQDVENEYMTMQNRHLIEYTGSPGDVADRILKKLLEIV